MGQIASMLTKVVRTRSPLQRELDTLTKVLGLVAWGAVAVIIVVGLLRGTPIQELLLLGTAMAISAIPTGLPAFVSGLLSMGAKQLAEAKAVVKNLTDVETLGATSAINTDKTGTLTLNEMMVSTLYAGGSWFTVTGEGYATTGGITAVAGAPTPDFTRLGLGLALDTDAVVGCRRQRDRRSDRGGPGGARRQDRRRRRADPARLSTDRRGPLRLRVQVHGHLPPDHPRRRRARRGVGQGRTRRRPDALHHGRRTVERLAGADRGRPQSVSTPRTSRWARADCGCSRSRSG